MVSGMCTTLVKWTHSSRSYPLFRISDYIQIGHPWFHHQYVSSLLYITILNQISIKAALVLTQYTWPHDCVLILARLMFNLTETSENTILGPHVIVRRNLNVVYVYIYIYIYIYICVYYMYWFSTNLKNILAVQILKVWEHKLNH